MHTDDQAVDRFAATMKEKLAKSRDKGRGGWDDQSVCDVEDLGRMLMEHVMKGDPVDIANFCMMLHERALDPVYVIRGAFLKYIDRHNEAMDMFRKIDEAGARGFWSVENALRMYKDVPVYEDPSQDPMADEYPTEAVVLNDFNKGIK